MKFQLLKVAARSLAFNPTKSQLRLFLLPTLILGFGLLPPGLVTAQVFTILHRFNGADGSTPWASLILSGNTLYGTTEYAGYTAKSAMFAVNTDGTGFTNLHSFNASSTNSSGTYTNSDGIDLEAGLISSGGTLYGMATHGGSLGFGTVFAVGTDGTGFTNLHTFTGYPGDGANPFASLIISGNTLYGTTTGGGGSDVGTVFALNTDGTGYTNLHSFRAGAYGSNGYTNSDGAYPEAGLILSGSTLYGTTAEGGSSGNGTVFRLNTDGTGFTNLHSLTASSTNSLGVYTNSDGTIPQAGLIVLGNTLYGTATEGGISGWGTVFAVNTDGTGFRNLHSFTATSGSGAWYDTNSDGTIPQAGLIISGNTLYGTTSGGGSSGWGTVFAINTNGTGFTTLHSFGLDGDGIEPFAGLVLSGNTLYGTASDYFTESNGTVFSLSFQPQLTIVPSGPNVILSWPTNVAGFDYTGYTLQSTTNLSLPSVWSTNSPAPILVDGQNTVANPIIGALQFYRLSQ